MAPRCRVYKHYDGFDDIWTFDEAPRTVEGPGVYADAQCGKITRTVQGPGVALGSSLIVLFTSLARAVRSRAKRGSAQRMKLYMFDAHRQGESKKRGGGEGVKQKKKKTKNHKTRHKNRHKNPRKTRRKKHKLHNFQFLKS